jgi:seryl-tRNA synthetase
MIDVKLLKSDKSIIQKSLEKRKFENPGILDNLHKISIERREIIQKTEELKAKRNQVSKLLGELKKKGEDISNNTKEMKSLSQDIKSLDEKLKILSEKEISCLMELPNILDESVPEGADESENVVVKEVGQKPKYNFQPKPHWEILEKENLVDFKRSAKISGARFYIYHGLISRLERALINFMLDIHTSENAYEEFSVPFLVNDESMIGTGQFPKFKDEYYTLEKDCLSLIPTAEVPLTNYYRDEIISEDLLPVKLTSATSCFRREAGAAGKDTRGLTRLHQFQKVELVCFCHPEESANEHEKMLSSAELVLQKLNLHYRVTLLCSGDTSAASSKTYDIDVWMPGRNKYVEVSSISNFKDFQARRAKIRFKGKKQKKPALIHTLNGSGLAAGRTVAAIIENFQTQNGKFEIPEILSPYMK